MSFASPSHLSSHPKRWEEKNPWISGVLAYLIPGAGHLYQGRTVKGLIYLFSILGLFFWGQKLGEGMVVYNLPEKGGVLRNVSLSYAAQLGAGISALPAFYQNRRAGQPTNVIVDRLMAPLTTSFRGHLGPLEDPEKGNLIGTIRLEPVEGPIGPEVRGTFEGTMDGQPTKIELGGPRFSLDRAIKGGYRRRIDVGVAGDGGMERRWISGTIPRPFLDAYGSPPDQEQLQEIYSQLGKTYELALVFTWIAGLLNILAIWDCILGPAYGFGDEQIGTSSAQEKPAATPAATVPAVNSAATPAVPEPASEPPRPDKVPNPKSPT